MLATSHGAWDDILDYTPTLRLFQGFVGITVLALAVTVVWAVLQRRQPGTGRLLSFITWGVAAVGILATMVIAGSIGVPQLVRTGDIPPQLVLTSNSGRAGAVIAVAFTTNQPTVNNLSYGPVGGTRRVLYEESPAKQHWLELKGLEQGEPYGYSLNGGMPTIFHVPSAFKPLRFAFAGDPHVGAPITGPTASLLEQIRNDRAGYDALFLLGDLVDRGYNDAFWKQALTSMSATTSAIPGGYVIGNHDSLFGGDRLFKDYLRGPESNRQLWQRFDFGNVHILLLDLEWEV